MVPPIEKNQNATIKQKRGTREKRMTLVVHVLPAVVRVPVPVRGVVPLDLLHEVTGVVVPIQEVAVDRVVEVAIVVVQALGKEEEGVVVAIMVILAVGIGT